MPIVSVFLTMLVCSALVMIFGTEVWMVIFPSLSSQWESFSVKAMGLTTNNTPGEALWTRGCPTEDHQIRSGN